MSEDNRKYKAESARSHRRHGFRQGFLEVTKPKDAKKTFRRLLLYLQRQKYLLVLVIAIVMFSTVISLFGPLLIGIAIDKYIIPGDLPGLARILILIGGIYAVTSLSQWFQVFIMVKASQKAIKRLREDLFERIQILSMNFFDTRSTGELMSRLINDVDNISSTMTQSVTQFVSSVLSMVGILIMMFVLSWQMALVSLLTIPAMFLGIKNIAEVTRKYFKQQQEALGTVNGIIEEKISGQKVVKAYCKEEETIGIFVEANNQLKNVSAKAQIYSRLIGPMMNLFRNASLAIIVSVGSYFVIHDIITIGIIAAFINYVRQFNRPLAHVAALYNTIQSALAGAERIFEVIDEEPKVKNIENAPMLSDIKGHVVFDKVNFEYLENQPVLKEVSFSAEAGEAIALVGPTGAGKTTIINLLTRFYDIKKGMITIDGKDITLVEKESLRKNLGIVLQDTFLFTGSVKENIRYGKLDATDEEIRQAAGLAYADHFIERLPEGYDTVLTKEGSNLSHGQRQLIAIARAILADTPILVLDEATSSVDTRTEVSIQKAFRNLMKGRTSFVIAHRLSTIRDADKILVVNHGKIIERGNHESLLAQEGFYYELYMSQFKSKSGNGNEMQ